MCGKCNVVVMIARAVQELVLYRKVDRMSGQPYEHNEVAHKEFPGDKVEKQQKGTANDTICASRIREKRKKRAHQEK